MQARVDALVARRRNDDASDAQRGIRTRRNDDDDGDDDARLHGTEFRVEHVFSKTALLHDAIEAADGGARYDRVENDHAQTHRK